MPQDPSKKPGYIDFTQIGKEKRSDRQKERTSQVPSTEQEVSHRRDTQRRLLTDGSDRPRGSVTRHGQRGPTQAAKYDPDAQKTFVRKGVAALIQKDPDYGRIANTLNELIIRPDQTPDTTDDAEEVTPVEIENPHAGAAEFSAALENYLENPVNQRAIQALSVVFGLLRRRAKQRGDKSNGLIEHLGFNNKELLDYLQTIFGAFNPDLRNFVQSQALASSTNYTLETILRRRVFDLDPQDPELEASSLAELERLTKVMMQLDKLMMQEDLEDLTEVIGHTDLPMGQKYTGEQYIEVAKRMGYPEKMKQRNLAGDLIKLRQWLGEEEVTEAAEPTPTNNPKPGAMGRPKAQKKPNEASEINPEAVARAYQELELPAGATKDEVKKKYHFFAYMYHPDRIKDMPGHMQASATDKFQAINNAYETLKKHLNIK